jgi:hypothetical protein
VGAAKDENYVAVISSSHHPPIHHSCLLAADIFVFGQQNRYSFGAVSIYHTSAQMLVTAFSLNSIEYNKKHEDSRAPRCHV